MASISTDKKGNRTIQFVAADKQRRSIRLGKMTLKDVREIKIQVESLNGAAIARIGWEPETAKWVGELESVLYDKLADVLLVPKRADAEQATLEVFIDRHIARRTDVKPATKEIWKQGKRGMIDYFGAAKPLANITPGDCDGYKLKLIGDKLAPMTVRKRLQFAKMICRAATRHKLIDADPFTDVSIKAGMPDRRRFITRAETDKLLAACPDHNWRAIVALARYGGLRCPSEVLSLTRDAIDWEAGRIRVASPKTEHHPGKESRMIPLFPELVEPLLTALEQAAGGSRLRC